MVVEDGKITGIGTNLPECEEQIDLGGKLVLPPYVDPHLHLDYVYTLSELGQAGAGSGPEPSSEEPGEALVQVI